MDYTGNPAIPSTLGPVAGIIQVDASTFVWGGAWAFNAGSGNWAYGGASYANFVAAYTASAAAGNSFLFTPTSTQWSAYTDPTMPDPAAWNIAVDIPEDLVVRYLNNTAAQGFFVSATIASPGISIYQNGQWGSGGTGVGDMRLLIAAPPTTAPWINASILTLIRTIALTSPTYNQSVTVTNAGTGTLNWTASAVPADTWCTVASASGTAGQSFQINLNVTGKAAGTYTTNVTVSASGANNTVVIPVTAIVVANPQPIMQLSPTSLTFTARPTDTTVPPSQFSQVNNTGLGTLSWSAAQQAPSVSWITSILPSTGANGSKFYVSVDHRGLAAGVYTKNVLVTDPNAANSPQTLTVTLNVQDQDADITKANSYDSAWEADKNGWAASMWHLRLNATGKTDGLVVLLGDSITYANPFGQWAHYGSGMTTADTTICTWMHAGNWGVDPPTDNTSNNGWYLAACDVTGRNGSYTARSGITAGQYLTGFAAPDLPGMDKMFTAGFTNPDGKQYRDAIMAVILLGTNDIGGGDTAGLTTNLGSIIDKLVADKIIPILTTLPPRVGSDTTVANFNTAIRNLAQSRAIPLIDFWAEITRRRPGQTWQNTLISGDGVHPTGSGLSYNSSSSPYVNNGEALSNVGYLLRDWLTVQKIAEVKANAIDIKPGDFNVDGSCDVIDLLIFVDTFGLVKGDANYDQRCDLNGDNSVDVIDLLTFVPYFGT